jgi:hypothetical protein
MMSSGKADKPLADIPLGIPNLGVVIGPPGSGSEGDEGATDKGSDDGAEERDDAVTPENGSPDTTPPR